MYQNWGRYHSLHCNFGLSDVHCLTPESWWRTERTCLRCFLYSVPCRGAQLKGLLCPLWHLVLVRLHCHFRKKGRQVPGPLCARQVYRHSAREVPLAELQGCFPWGLWHQFLFFFSSSLWRGQKPNLIYALVFIKVSECSGLTPLNVRSDAWLFPLLMSCITEILGYRRVLELNMWG